MNNFIALGITEDVSYNDDGIITEKYDFSMLVMNGLPIKVSIFYIGY